jgi:outer membrane protein TolC
MKKISIYVLLSFCSFSVWAQQPNLSEYRQTATDNNPQLQAAYTKYETALEKLPQLSGLPDPTLTFAYALSPIETRLGPQQAKLSLTQMFPWFGTLNAKEEQAALMAEAAYEEYSDLKSKTHYQVAAVYYDNWFISQSIRHTSEQIKVFKKLERLANTQFENSRSSMVDVLRFQMTIEELEAQLVNLKDKQKTLSVKFNLLLNIDSNAKINVADSLPVPDKELYLSDSLSDNNPKLKALRANRASADYQLKAERLSSYPNFGIGLDYAFIGQPETMAGGTDAIMPMISISLPIYRKKYKARIRESELAQVAADYKIEAYRNDLRAEFQKASENYRKAYRDLSLYNSLLKKARKTLDILETSYANSGKNYDQLLEVQNSLLKYQIKRDKALSDLYSARAYLNYLSAE